MILGCMILLGFGIGIISNVGPVLVQEHFDGEERATVMGWQIGFNNVGMMVLTAVGGALGASNWRNLF
ncbi:MFS transporter [Limosilactobacillus fermentum]|nr:MFS transporter [Limosilactobacillus fermentum]